MLFKTAETPRTSLTWERSTGTGINRSLIEKQVTSDYLLFSVQLHTDTYENVWFEPQKKGHKDSIYVKERNNLPIIISLSIIGSI